MKKQIRGKRRERAAGTPELVRVLRKWQEIEDGSVASTTQITAKTKNPFIRLVMDIIRQDSIMHKKVQQFMIDSLEKEAVSLTPEEWEKVKRECDKIGYCCFTPEDQQKGGTEMVELDLRSIVPFERHELIFQKWDSLKPGETLQITNDHDPKPLALSIRGRIQESI
jgi:hypothetical protein